MPKAEREAPPVKEELSQPRPGPDAGFEHGQAIVPDVPASQKLAER